MRRVSENGLWGAVDRDGNRVVPCQYGKFEKFHYGYAWVRKKGCWGIMGESGHDVVPCRYERVGFMYYNDYLPGGFYACKDGRCCEGWGKDCLTK